MSMSWHAGGSDFLIRHIKRLGQTEQTGKERQTRWGPSNCLRYTVGVCACLDGGVRKCVPCRLHVWVSTVQVCIRLHLGMCLRLWYYVNMFKVFCSSLWRNVISFPLCTKKVMKALGQRRRILHVSGGSFVSFFTAFKLEKENFSTPSLHSVSQWYCCRYCCKDNKFANVSSQEKTYVCPCSSYSYH